MLLAAVAALFGCDGGPAPPASRPAGGARIVSLSPAMTRTVVDLGAGDAIVGRTPWCVGVDAPVVGTLHDRDSARILDAAPTLIVVQDRAADAALVRLAEQCGATLEVRHVDSLESIRAMARSMAERLGEQGYPQAAANLAALEARARDAERAAGPTVAASGRTVLLFGADPPSAFGQGTFASDLWQALGGTNAITRQGYPELTLEDIVALDPDRIVLVRMRPGEVPPALAALPERLRTRVRSVVAPELLEPSTALLVDGPAALAEGAR